jgi:hypothetical protein
MYSCCFSSSTWLNSIISSPLIIIISQLNFPFQTGKAPRIFGLGLFETARCCCERSCRVSQRRHPAEQSAAAVCQGRMLDAAVSFLFDCNVVVMRTRISHFSFVCLSAGHYRTRCRGAFAQTAASMSVALQTPLANDTHQVLECPGSSLLWHCDNSFK